MVFAWNGPDGDMGGNACMCGEECDGEAGEDISGDEPEVGVCLDRMIEVVGVEGSSKAASSSAKGFRLGVRDEVRRFLASLSGESKPVLGEGRLTPLLVCLGLEAAEEALVGLAAIGPPHLPFLHSTHLQTSVQASPAW